MVGFDQGTGESRELSWGRFGDCPVNKYLLSAHMCSVIQWRKRGEP